MIDHQDILAAKARIGGYVAKTPTVTSSLLNEWLGHEIHFKLECLQKVGAFKARGGCNAVQCLLEQHGGVKRVVANSSGNHAQAIAWSAAQFGLPATIYMPSFASAVKAQATRSYGAKVVQLDTRQAVDAAVAAAAEESGVHWIPPFNDVTVVAGQGTAAMEAIEQLSEPVDAVFAPCGGGGLLSGTLVATRHLLPQAKVMAAEPLAGDDAMRSYQSGEIQRLKDAPQTLADGAQTLSVGPVTFEHLKHLDDFFAVDEPEIQYWTQWLQHLLKMQHVEPTSAMVMDAVCQWLRTQSQKQRVLVILTGGNIDTKTMHQIWSKDCLVKQPRVHEPA